MATFVSARLLNGFLRHLAVQRIDVDALVGDLPIDLGDEARSTTLVDWEDVAELGVRLDRGLGGAEALEDLGAAIVASRPMPALRRLMGWTAAPSVLYRIGLRWFALHMPRDMSTHIGATEDGRIEIRVALPDAGCSSEPIFHMLTGAVRAFPTLVDLPESVVETRLEPHSATFRITPSGSGTLWRRTLRNVRTLLGSNDAIEDLEEERQLLRRHVDQLERALFESSERENNLRSLVEASDELLLLVDPDGRIHTASESARRVTGYAPEQIVGSHLTLWFHRDDDARVRGFVARAFSGDDGPAEGPLRARHERGRWLETQLDARVPASTDGVHRIVISVREIAEAGDGSTGDSTLATRFTTLERRHQDLRDMHAKLLEAERVAATREFADLLEASVGAALQPLVEGLDVAAHVHGEAQPDLVELSDLAQRIDAGLERTLSTLRRAKQERTHQSTRDLVSRFESALVQRLEGFGVRIRLDASAVPRSTRSLVDADLVAAGFDHVAEHVAQSARTGGRIEVDVDDTEDGVLRLAVRAGCAAPLPELPRVAPVDLELARGLLRAQGGDAELCDDGPRGPELVITLPVEDQR